MSGRFIKINSEASRLQFTATDLLLIVYTSTSVLKLIQTYFLLCIIVFIVESVEAVLSNYTRIINAIYNSQYYSYIYLLMHAFPKKVSRNTDSINMPFISDE